MNRIENAHLITMLKHLGYGGFAANVSENLDFPQTLINNGATMRVFVDGATATFEWQNRRGILLLEGNTLQFTEMFTPRSYSERSHWRALYAACHQGDDGNFESSVWAELAGSMALPVVLDMAETKTPAVFRQSPGRWLNFSWTVDPTAPHLPMEIFRDQPIGLWMSFGLLIASGRGLGQSMITPFRRTAIEVSK